MKLLIITATRGDSEWFDETISSVAAVRAQGVDLIWVIVCPIGRRDFVKAKVGDHIVVAEAVKGLYSGINQGIREVLNSDWTHFTYINDDDGLRPLGFVHLCSEMGRVKPDVIYGDIDYVDCNGRIIGSVSIARWPSDLLPLLARGIAPFSQQGMIVSRAILDKVGMFDESLSHVADAHFWVKCLKARAQFYYVNVTAAFYRIRPGQLSNATDVMANQTAQVTAFAGNDSRIGVWTQWRALMRFRLLNMPRVLSRLRRVGWVSSRRMFSRGCVVAPK